MYPDDIQKIIEDLFDLNPKIQRKAARRFIDNATICYPLLISKLSEPGVIATSPAIELLGEFGSDSQARNLIKRLLEGKDTNEFIKATCLKSLGKIGNFEDIDYIAEFMNSDDRRMRANSIEALALYEDNDQVVELIRSRLDDSDNRVRANAVIALWQHGDSSVRDVLKQMISHPDVLMQQSGRYVLGVVGLQYVDDLMKNSFFEEGQENRDNRRDAIFALGLLISKRFI